METVFYGIFSAWVLWAQQRPAPIGTFDWRTAVCHLRAPLLRALFQQLSDPGRRQLLGLVEVLDGTAVALNRVDREAFFTRFDEGEAVLYFYEPFLQAFDPDFHGSRSHLWPSNLCVLFWKPLQSISSIVQPFLLKHPAELNRTSFTGTMVFVLCPINYKGTKAIQLRYREEDVRVGYQEPEFGG